MPLTFDSVSRTDAITVGVARLIRRGGLAAVTMRVGNSVADVEGRARHRRR